MLFSDLKVPLLWLLYFQHQLLTVENFDSVEACEFSLSSVPSDPETQRH